MRRRSRSPRSRRHSPRSRRPHKRSRHSRKYEDAPQSRKSRYEWGRADDPDAEEEEVSEVEEVNLQPSGALYEDTQDVDSASSVKYHEPRDACKPDKHWRLYVFKDEKHIGK